VVNAFGDGVGDDTSEHIGRDRLGLHGLIALERAVVVLVRWLGGQGERLDLRRGYGYR
jgi:hypothetical protein